jgi:hypothetical protein
MHTDFLRDAQRLDNLVIDVPKKPVITSFKQTFASFGSCFAQNLQRLILSYGFDFWFNREVSAHYSSQSLAAMFKRVISQRTHTKNDLYQSDSELNEIVAWGYFKLKRRGPNAVENILKRMAELDADCLSQIQTRDIIIITLGTTRVARYKNDGSAMSNCSGIPSREWTFELEGVAETVNGLEESYQCIRDVRKDHMPALFLTISPQRYLFKEPIKNEMSPFVENNLCKATLNVAVHEFLNNHKNDNINYYPAYDIVMDELRHFESISIYDYCHINQDGTPKHVVKRFLQSYCSEEILKGLPLIEQVREVLLDIDSLTKSGLSKEDPFITDKILKMWKEFQVILDGNPCTEITGPLVTFLHKYKRYQTIVDHFDVPYLDLSSRLHLTLSLIELGQYQKAKDNLMKAMPLLTTIEKSEGSKSDFQILYHAIESKLREAVTSNSLTQLNGKSTEAVAA